MLDPDMRENLNNYKDFSDKYFFKKLPIVKFLDGTENKTEQDSEVEEYNIYEAYDTIAIIDD